MSKLIISDDFYFSDCKVPEHRSSFRFPNNLQPFSYLNVPHKHPFYGIWFDYGVDPLYCNSPCVMKKTKVTEEIISWHSKSTDDIIWCEITSWEYNEGQR